MENIVESKNLFKYDAPVGRKRFIKNFLILVACYIPVLIASVLLRLFLGARTGVLIFLIAFLILTYLPFLYCSAINYAKRLYDITQNKKKSLLYVILLYILTFALGSIPVLVPVSLLISLGFACLCFFAKGKMLTFDNPEAETANNEE